jgi:hypothetical protein
MGIHAHSTLREEFISRKALPGITKMKNPDAFNKFHP